MANKMNRREFLDTAAQVTCGCALAAGLGGCTVPGEESAQQSESGPDAFCGLYCGACPLYQMSVKAEDPSQIKCLGCKSDKVADHCAKCQMKTCATAKNLSSCGECDQFPCEKTEQFHRSGRDMALVAEKNCYQIRKEGYSSWLQDQPQRWICTKCGSSFSFRDETCPNCNADVYSCKEEAAAYRETSA